MNAFVHETVMREETVAALAPRAGRVYADATLGGGGHAEAILEASSPDGRLIGIDRDEIALDAARARLARFGARATLVHGEMADVREILSGAGAPRVDGLVADLGTSSPQLDDSARGFSFSSEGPLDMRMDRSRGETARELLARLSEREIADVVYQYGEEKKSRRVARSIVRAREEGKLETTADLARAVRAALGPKRGRIDPATRTFQAIRIAVNGELDQLTALIDALPDVLEDSGVAAIISFHSLEDRIVKQFLREHCDLVTKKPIIAGPDEVRRNPRARSAKLRCGVRRAESEAA
jgi:16S rRNA (cytosine1402-N4)-methyltransferase